MRILFLASEFPHPAESGVTIKTASVLEYLRARHDVRLLCFNRSPLTAEQREWAADAGAATAPLNRPRSALNLIRSYLSGVPLSIERNRSREMWRLVGEALAGEEPQAVFVDGWLMAQYLPEGFPGLRLLHEHNAEHVLWLRQAQLETNPLRLALLRREYRRVKAYEAGMLRRFDTVFAVSEEDRRALGELAPGADIRVLPNLPQRDLLARPDIAFEQTEPLVFYFGTLSWPPNLEGLRFLLRDVWPLVVRQAPGARLLIAGRGAPPRLARLARGSEGVEFAGPLQDPEPAYRRARVFVEATHSGGGTKLKVLNALARGIPVVATPQAAEGLQLVPGEHLLVADGPAAIARAVLRLLDDPQLWTALSRNARCLLRERRIPEVAFADLDEALSGARTKSLS